MSIRNAIVVAAGAASVVALAAAPASAAAVPCVQKVAVVNNGGFVLNFQHSTLFRVGAK